MPSWDLQTCLNFDLAWPNASLVLYSIATSVMLSRTLLQDLRTWQKELQCTTLNLVSLRRKFELAKEATGDNWVSFKDLKLSYHNGYIYIYRVVKPLYPI